MVAGVTAETSLRSTMQYGNFKSLPWPPRPLAGVEDECYEHYVAPKSIGDRLAAATLDPSLQMAPSRPGRPPLLGKRVAPASEECEMEVIQKKLSEQLEGKHCTLRVSLSRHHADLSNISAQLKQPLPQGADQSVINLHLKILRKLQMKREYQEKMLRELEGDYEVRCANMKKRGPRLMPGLTTKNRCSPSSTLSTPSSSEGKDTESNNSMDSVSSPESMAIVSPCAPPSAGFDTQGLSSTMSFEQQMGPIGMAGNIPTTSGQKKSEYQGQFSVSSNQQQHNTGEDMVTEVSLPKLSKGHSSGGFSLGFDNIQSGGLNQNQQKTEQILSPQFNIKTIPTQDNLHPQLGFPAPVSTEGIHSLKVQQAAAQRKSPVAPSMRKFGPPSPNPTPGGGLGSLPQAESNRMASLFSTTTSSSNNGPHTSNKMIMGHHQPHHQFSLPTPGGPSSVPSVVNRSMSFPGTGLNFAPTGPGSLVAPSAGGMEHLGLDQQQQNQPQYDINQPQSNQTSGSLFSASRYNEPYKNQLEQRLHLTPSSSSQPRYNTPQHSPNHHNFPVGDSSSSLLPQGDSTSSGSNNQLQTQPMQQQGFFNLMTSNTTGSPGGLSPHWSNSAGAGVGGNLHQSHSPQPDLPQQQQHPQHHTNSQHQHLDGLDSMTATIASLDGSQHTTGSSYLTNSLLGVDSDEFGQYMGPNYGGVVGGNTISHNPTDSWSLQQQQQQVHKHSWDQQQSLALLPNSSSENLLNHHQFITDSSATTTPAASATTSQLPLTENAALEDRLVSDSFVWL